jgi:RecA/RadA recombinase
MSLPFSEDPRLDTLEIHPTTIDALRCAGLHSALQTLHYSQAELQAATKLSAKHIGAALHTIAQRMAPQVATAKALRARARALPLGDAALDAVLGGGLPLRSITELCGASGCGKTQLALQWCLRCRQMDGGNIWGRVVLLYMSISLLFLPTAAIYISTESAFPSQRLEELAQHYAAEMRCEPADLTNNVLLAHCVNGRGMVFSGSGSFPFPKPPKATTNDLGRVLYVDLPRMLQHRSDVRLVVIDSMAAQFRTEFAVEEAADRSNTIFGFARLLKFLADRHDLAVLCINQVFWEREWPVWITYQLPRPPPPPQGFRPRGQNREGANEHFRHGPGGDSGLGTVLVVVHQHAVAAEEAHAQEL